MRSSSTKAGGGSRGPMGPFTPPNNYSAVAKDVYRSAYPAEPNVPFLRHIGVRTVVLLSIERLPYGVLTALKADHDPLTSVGTTDYAAQLTPASGGSYISARHKDRHHSGTFPSTTFPCVTGKGMRVIELADLSRWRMDCLNANDDFSQSDVKRALDFAVDVQWHPVLFCCPTGELQTSVLVGCLRRYQGWSLAAIYGECELFANLQRDLRVSLMTFIEAWRPEENPISTTDIIQRNSEWANECTQQMHQQRKKQRRLLRQQQLQHGGANPAIGRHPRSHPFRGPNSVNGSVTVSSGRASGDSASSSGEESDGYTDDSTRSAGNCALGVSTAEPRPSPSLQQQQSQHPPLGGEKVTEEGIVLTGSGKRSPSLWHRRRPTAAFEEKVVGTLSTSTSFRVGRSQLGADAATFHNKHLSEVVFAEWFEEARHRNPLCCVDTAEWGSSSRLEHILGQEKDSAIIEENKRNLDFPCSPGEMALTSVPAPHVRYAGVRNPPVLDSRSTFTKQSIVDEDDD